MRETTPIKPISTKNGETHLKRLSLVDTSKKSIEFTAWGQQAEFLESIEEELKSNCILAAKLAQVNKHDTYGTRVQSRENTKIMLMHRMSPEDRKPFQTIINQLQEMYSGGKNMEGMKGLTEGGGEGASPLVSIEILSAEINENHPDMSATFTRERDGRSFITGLKRTLRGHVTWVKAPSN